MANTRGNFVRRNGQGRGLATGGVRRHSVAVAMLVLMGIPGSAIVLSGGAAAAAPQSTVSTDVSAAGAAAAKTLEQDAGVIGVLATEIACAGLLLAGMRRYSADRRKRGLN